MPDTVVRVLVVDSDTTGRQEICRALERSGFELLETSSAAEAGEVLRGEPPGAVVVDTLLSDQSGFAVCRTIRESPETKDVPVLMLSRSSSDMDRILALEAAWSHADPWLDEVLAYLEANRDFVAEFVRSELPGVRHFAPEGTYLAWLDCRALGLAPSPQRFFLERAKVGLSDGPTFGAPGEGFVRLNFATSRAILTRALEQMAKSLR